MQKPETRLCLEYVSAAYNGRTVVHDVSFSLVAGEVLAIVGESGSGKTTILKAIMHLLGSKGSNSGSILYTDSEGHINDLAALSDSQARLLYGGEIAFVFQDCLSSLTPIRTIEAQLYEMVEAHDIAGEPSDRQIIRKHAEELLAHMGVTEPERILRSYPFELSGGLGQRVGIMFALIMKPRVLLLDEPTSALDVLSQQHVLQELLHYKQEECCTMVLVTHNISLARALADYLIVLKDGQVQEQGNTENILKHPSNSYTRTLLDAACHLSLRNQDSLSCEDDVSPSHHGHNSIPQEYNSNSRKGAKQ